MSIRCNSVKGTNHTDNKESQPGQAADWWRDNSSRADEDRRGAGGGIEQTGPQGRKQNTEHIKHTETKQNPSQQESEQTKSGPEHETTVHHIECHLQHQVTAVSMETQLTFRK